MRHIVLGLVLLAVPTGAFAQALTPEYAKVLVLPAAGDIAVPPVVTGTPQIISPTSANCNLTPTVAPPISVNPSLAAFDDPFHPSKMCSVPLPTGIPAGTGYRMVMVLGLSSMASCLDVPGGTMITPCESPRALGVPPFDVVIRTRPMPATGVGPR